MPYTHLLLTLLVIIIWGLNFLFVKLALLEMSPFLLCAARFILASIPAIFFVERPSIPFKTVALYGLVMFALQFTLLFMSMRAGMPAGMASLLMQIQVFFSMFLSAILFNEKPNFWQILGAIISFSGIGFVAMHFNANISLAGFLLILGASLSWGIGNLITKNAATNNRMALIIWSSFIAALPMCLLSFFIDGSAAMIDTMKHLSWLGTVSLLYIVYGSTWVGYGVWNWLLSRHAVSAVVPFTLLIPIVGVFSSILLLNEPFEPWKVMAGVLVLGGLGINIMGTRYLMKKIIVAPFYRT